jgi:malonyl-CoA/methylmalonyl-CoA synthetase
MSGPHMRHVRFGQALRLLHHLPATIVERAQLYADRIALVAAGGAHSYRELDAASARAAGWLLAGERDLREARVAYLVEPGFDHVVTQWAVWRAGGIAVPLALSHPPAELDYVIRDSEAAIVIASAGRAPTIAPLAVLAGARFGTPEDFQRVEPGALPRVERERRAMMLYTSGTTGRPKGVVHTHANLAAQIATLVEAWKWTEADRILGVLPLHHVHGIVNILGSALWSGAVCELHSRFDAAAAWERLASGELTLFMAVPTIYRRLIQAWEAETPEVRRRWSQGSARLRLMVSGSAALPIQTLERWREITGHVLLERYGMTEIGMALSNPLEGERRPAHVGMPLPGVDVRLVDDQGGPVPAGAPGEIEVKGPGVFLEYWRRPDATRDAFQDGWFRTGDTAVLDEGSYRILGRTSVDIIKTGGYKVSALEIEEVLRTHPAIAECAVVGVDDPDWGERVCAAIEPAPDQTLSLAELQAWARQRLAPYKVPRSLICVSNLPRNAMGKVVKPDVAALFGR